MIIGGAARSLINFRGPLLKELIASDYEVIACAPDATPDIRRQLEHMGVWYRHFPLARAGLSPIGDLRTLRALKHLMREEKPDRVLAYTAKPVIYGHLAARYSGGPMVFGMITGLGYAFGNGSAKQSAMGLLVRHLYRLALKNSSGIFFQNPDDPKVFNAQGLLPDYVPVTLINGSGVDLEWYAPAPLPDAPVFLLVARLLADKGIQEYYHAASIIKKKYPHARFLLAGDLDPNPSSISKNELTRWQSETVIDYLGKLDDIRPAFVRSKVYVLPSYREGTPRTVLEAMAMGRPVVTTDAPGCRETVIDGKNGFLVPVKDAARLAEAMERFIAEPLIAERMGRESLRIAREKYDVHKVNKVIMTAMGL